ncbi:MAG: hypothetical protein ACK55I_28485, partial [bacterium]
MFVTRMSRRPEARADPRRLQARKPSNISGKRVRMSMRMARPWRPGWSGEPSGIGSTLGRSLGGGGGSLGDGCLRRLHLGNEGRSAGVGHHPGELEPRAGEFHRLHVGSLRSVLLDEDPHGVARLG